MTDLEQKCILWGLNDNWLRLYISRFNVVECDENVRGVCDDKNGETSGKWFRKIKYTNGEKGEKETGRKAGLKATDTEKWPK